MLSVHENVRPSISAQKAEHHANLYPYAYIRSGSCPYHANNKAVASYFFQYVHVLSSPFSAPLIDPGGSSHTLDPAAVVVSG